MNFYNDQKILTQKVWQKYVVLEMAFYKAVDQKGILYTPCSEYDILSLKMLASPLACGYAVV